MATYRKGAKGKMQARKTELEAESVIEELERKYGKEYLELCLWARENAHIDLFNLIYCAFEFSPSRIDPNRIIEEIKLPGGVQILSGWSDNELSRSLLSYFNDFKYSELDKRSLSREATAEQAKKVPKHLEESGYLLALSSSQLFVDGSFDTVYYQTLLRLWLVIHGLNRLKHHSGYDSLISLAARYLIVDSADFAKKDLLKGLFKKLDQRLLQEEASFEFTNRIVDEAARLIIQQHESELPQGQKNFLSRLSRIANFEHDPVRSKSTNTVSIASFISQKPLQITRQIAELYFGDEESRVHYSEESLDNLKTEEPEDDGFLTIETRADMTPAEQIAIGHGIYIERAEQAHFLPWSWDKVLPPEKDDLNAWLDEKLSSNKDHKALPAALIKLALQFGRSLENVLKLTVDQPISNEWCLDVDFGLARRQAIRRHSAYRPKPHQKDWLTPSQEEIAMPVDNAVASILRTSASNLEFKPKQINQLWAAYYNESLFVWFNQNLPEGLKRLKSSMVATSLGQEVFNHTSDSSLARAWSSHPQNALPAACGYGSWDVSELLEGKAPTSNVKKMPSVSLVGSRLLPIEDALETYVAELYKYVAKAQSQIDFHNRFTFYTIQALYAATGVRYLTDPFESLAYFYLDDNNKYFPSSVFINDKEDDIHSGRLVPLCQQAEKLVRDYLAHLANFAVSIKETSQHLSTQIHQLLNRNPAHLPLFFFLNNRLQWQSMSETELLKELPSFPLPKNTFRHRFSQRMTSLGLPSDVLEGWMGHGERGAAAYGDYSPRCWKTDALEYSNLLENNFNSLGFKRINSSLHELPLGAEQTDIQEATEVVFGARKRQESRERTLANIQEQTQDRIDKFLDNRQWSEITPEEFSEFVQGFGKATDGSIAITYPLERMNILRANLEQAESPLIQHIKSRLVSLKQEASHLSSSVATAVSIFPKIKDWCEKHGQAYPKDLSLKQSGQLGVILLAVEKQLSYQKMLEDIADGENFQLVQFGRECLIRYSEELKKDDFLSAAQSHRISYKTASLLNAFKGSKHKVNLKEALAFKPLEELALTLNLKTDCQFDDLLAMVCQVIEQVNLVSLPGLVAAGLSHRQPPTSLSLHDFIRIQSRSPLVAPSDSNGFIEPEFNQLMPVSSEWLKATNPILKKEANAYHKAINEALFNYEPSKAKECAKTVEKISASFSGRVSTAVLATGYWISHTILIGNYQGRRKNFSPLAKNTIVTYWGTLIVAFKELAYDKDILTLSEDEFYALYQEMLSYKQEKENKTEYFGNRLQAYHKFLTTQGVPNLDWSELDFEDRARNVSSGFITEKDYQSTLKYLGQKFQDKDQATTLQFILLLGYRFGLRIQEATYLLRTDWVETNNRIHVLIRNNKYRSLKTNYGRRAVPLLFELSEPEQKIVKTVFERYEFVAGKDVTQLILSEIRDSEIVLKPACYAASREIITALREVTGNPSLVFHHTRHSFCNRIAAAMFGINTNLTGKINKTLDQPFVVRELLGPSHALDRRASMALAVIMGHKHASTSLKSYNHLITEWADNLLSIKPTKTHRLSEAIQLDEWEKWVQPKIKTVAKIEFVQPSVESLMQLMRLVALGKTFDQAVHIIGLHPSHAEALETLAAESFIKEEANLPSGITEDSIFGVREFLSHISDTAWKRLLSSCDNECEIRITPTISLNELPLLIGNKRQILMAKDQHYQLVKQLKNYFKLPKQSYGISLYPRSIEALEKIKKHELNDDSLAENKPIDVMRERDTSQRGAVLQDYASFWLKDRLSDTSLRNSYEVVVAILILGYLA